jgi:hypothetical protein
LDKTVCEWAKEGFINAGRRIAEVLDIRQTIKVSASFHSFCDKLSGSTSTPTNGTVGNSTATSAASSNATTVVKCDRKDTLGQASAAAFFSARSMNDSNAPWFFYPQALVKQLKQDYELQ